MTKEKLDDLHVPDGLRERLAPSVHPVAAQQERVRGRMLSQRIANRAGEPRHVLVVLEHGQPLRVLMRGDPFEAFEHFVAADAQSTAIRRPSSSVPKRSSTCSR